eukprot:462844-Amorphochlora_amoeboformis.AAC.3
MPLEEQELNACWLPPIMTAIGVPTVTCQTSPILHWDIPIQFPQSVWEIGCRVVGKTKKSPLVFLEAKTYVGDDAAAN